MEKLITKKQTIEAKIFKQEEDLKKSKDALKKINADIKAAEKKAAKK